jgi:hypothetical protein
MQWLSLTILAFTGGCIFYQDIKTRTVTWFLFPLIAVTGILYSVYYSGSLNILFKNSLINTIFLLAQFLLLKSIYFLKNGSNEQLIDKSIGSGDILFLIACSFFFSPVNFMIFYCLSLVFTLLNHMVFKSVRIKREKLYETVPLAGFQAIFLFIYILINVILHNNLTTDDRLIAGLTNS